MSIYRSRDRIAVIAATVAAVPPLEIHGQCGWSLDRKSETGKMCFVVLHLYRLYSLKPLAITRITANPKYLNRYLPSYRYCAVCRLLFFEDVMGGAQHYHISEVVAQSKEPEAIIGRGDRSHRISRFRCINKPLTERLLWENTKRTVNLKHPCQIL